MFTVLKFVCLSFHLFPFSCMIHTSFCRCPDGCVFSTPSHLITNNFLTLLHTFLLYVSSYGHAYILCTCTTLMFFLLTITHGYFLTLLHTFLLYVSSYGHAYILCTCTTLMFFLLTITHGYLLTSMPFLKFLVILPVFHYFS